MRDKQKQYQTQHKWNKENTTLINIRFMKNTEQDLLDHLSRQDNKSGYIKDLIRADMQRQERTE